MEVRVRKQKFVICSIKGQLDYDTPIAIDFGVNPYGGFTTNKNLKMMQECEQNKLEFL